MPVSTIQPVHIAVPFAAGPQEQGTSDGPSQGSPDSADASGSAGEAGSLDDSCSSDSESGTVKIDLQLPRRSMLVQFTCDKCTGRSERLVNPLAWNKGMVSPCRLCIAGDAVCSAATQACISADP